MINKYSYRDFGNTVIFRLLHCYVNYLLSVIYYVLLHNHNLRGFAGDDVITTSR